MAGTQEPLERWGVEDFCYVVTTGRVTGRPHEIEIWFAVSASRVYTLSGGGERSDWVRNIQADPNVILRIDAARWHAKGRIVTDAEEDALARRLLAAKYQGWREGMEMTTWASTALPVALDVTDQRDLAG